MAKQQTTEQLLEFEKEELQEAIDVILEVVVDEKRHKDYERVCDLADKYYRYVTGIGLEKEMRQFHQRENNDQFEQRQKITKHIIPAVVGNLTSVERKIPRSNGMIRVIGYEGDEQGTKTEEFETIIDKFWGNKSFDDWMALRYFELNDIDPNTFMVAEWDDFDPVSEHLTPYPYEVSAHQAVMFDYDNNILKYLIDMKSVQKIDPEEQKQKEALRFTMYMRMRTIIAEQVFDNNIAGKVTKEKEAQKIGGSLYFKDKDDKLYEIKFVTPEHKAGVVPAFRVGFKRDEATGGRTCVAPYHNAICYLEKTVNANSEMDLTSALHVFPQKLMKTRKCKNPDCFGGKLVDGTDCPVCKGEGLEIHKSAQDIIWIRMPDAKEEDISLENIARYLTPEVALLEFQDAYIEKLTHSCKQAMFNADIFTKQQISQTATEKTIDLDNVYDTLYPWALRFSQDWKFTVRLIAKLTDMDDGLVIAHSFSKDFKFKTKDDYIADRAAAVKAEAPDEILRTIDDEIVRIDNADNPDEFKKYLVKQEFSPFSGKSQEEIIDIKSRGMVPKWVIVLDDNFGYIFDEIERDEPEFYSKKKGEQYDIIQKKVQQIMDDIETPTTKLPEFE